MTNTNQYVPFATGGGALTLDPITYASLTERLQGFQNGTADPQKFNTFARQTSVMAAMIGQFIADFNTANLNALDNGSVAGLEAGFVNALKGALIALFGSGFVRVGLTDTGTANAIVIDLVPAAISPYTIPMFSIIKKSSSAGPNTGPVTANFNNVGTVALMDNTGAALTSGALVGGGIYAIMFDGAIFRILGGTTTYTNISNLTVASGEGISVTTGSIVNLNYPGLVHDAIPANADLVSRFKNATLHHVEMTWLEEIAALALGLNLGQSSKISLTVPGTTLQTVPIFARRMRYRLWGGGGGGGGSSGPNQTGGGGGGGAEYREGIVQVITGGIIQPGQVITCVVGTGGTAGAGAFIPQSGGAGTASSIGSFVVANGGLGGVGNGPGGLGGTGGSGGDAIFPGSPGVVGSATFNPPVVGIGGTGGSTFGSSGSDGHPVFGINGRAPGGGAGGGAPNAGIAESGGVGGDGRIDMWFEG